MVLLFSLCDSDYKFIHFAILVVVVSAFYVNIVTKFMEFFFFLSKIITNRFLPHTRRRRRRRSLVSFVKSIIVQICEYKSKDGRTDGRTDGAANVLRTVILFRYRIFSVLHIVNSAYLL